MTGLNVCLIVGVALELRVCSGWLKVPPGAV